MANEFLTDAQRRRYDRFDGDPDETPKAAVRAASLRRKGDITSDKSWVELAAHTSENGFVDYITASDRLKRDWCRS